jgi:hypothetical protein
MRDVLPPMPFLTVNANNREQNNLIFQELIQNKKDGDKN